MLIKRSFVIILLFLFSLNAYGQELSSDELFQKARTAAFDQKDYATAIALSKIALEKSPNYTDISVFLGRLYTWSNDLPGARKVFQGLDQKEVQDEDFFMAYASLEYWNDDYAKAIEILDKGLKFHPDSENLLLLKTKVLYAKEDYNAADEANNAVLALNPQNTEARSLSTKINDVNAKNAVGITYSYSHFDKQFDSDWQFVGLSYKRVTPIGSIILKGNFARKFEANGTQIEIEAYPKLSKTFYLYIGAGYSNDVGIFPKYRTGVSLNANLPKSYEAEIGFRQLYFTDNIWIYTASVGKYYKNYWFNLRTYITPSNNNISQSYTGTVRYYLKGAQDYLAFQMGTGISPEEIRSSLLGSETYKLKTFKIGAEYNFSVNRTNLFSISTMYYHQEYRPNENGNQYDFSIGYTKKF